MKQKLFYFLACAMVVLCMAGCGDTNDPEHKAFSFRLVRKGDVAATMVVTPANSQAEYIVGHVDRETVWNDEVLASYIRNKRLNGHTYQELRNNSEVVCGESRIEATDLKPASENVLYACQVDKELNIVKLSFEYVTTLPAGQLNGEFTVDAKGTKVRFSKGNLRCKNKDQTYYFADNQWDALRGANSFSATWRDLLLCSKTLGTPPIEYGHESIVNGGNAPDQWFTLSGDQWEYLLKSRERAKELNRVGYITIDGTNDMKGLIFLPDNWSGISLAEKNAFTAFEWWEMELAGAVFLPVTGYSNSSRFDKTDDLNIGYYMSTTKLSTGAYPVVILKFPYADGRADVSQVMYDCFIATRLVQKIK